MTGQWVQVLGGVLVALVTAAGMYGVNLLNSRTTKDKTTSDIQRDLIEDLRTQQDRDRADAKSKDAEREARITALEVADGIKESQIADLRGKLHAVIEDRDGVVSYLKTLWRWVVEGAKPPPPPIPDHLHDILPPTDYVWPTPPQTFDDTTD